MTDGSRGMELLRSEKNASYKRQQYLAQMILALRDREELTIDPPEPDPKGKKQWIRFGVPMLGSTATEATVCFKNAARSYPDFQLTTKRAVGGYEPDNTTLFHNQSFNWEHWSLYCWTPKYSCRVEKPAYAVGNVLVAKPLSTGGGAPTDNALNLEFHEQSTFMEFLDFEARDRLSNGEADALDHLLKYVSSSQPLDQPVKRQE